MDGKGLHQLTADDLDGQDAMSNLSNDGVMTNVINSSSPFNLHIKSITAGYPCVIITATDGCFGYLNSPMEFEHLLIDSLVNSKNIIEWKNSMYNRISEVAGDDFTLCVAVCGFDSFDSIKNSFVGRNKYIINKYIENENDVNDMWNEYKEEYSMYM